MLAPPPAPAPAPAAPAPPPTVVTDDDVVFFKVFAATDCADMWEAALMPDVGAEVFFTNSAGSLGAVCFGGSARLGGFVANFG